MDCLPVRFVTQHRAGQRESRYMHTRGKVILLSITESSCRTKMLMKMFLFLVDRLDGYFFMSASPPVHFFVHLLLLSIISINAVTSPLQTHCSLQNLARGVKCKIPRAGTRVLITARW